MMDAMTARRRRAETPVTRAWSLAKKLDNSEKLELMAMLIDSVKVTVSTPSMKRFTMDDINDMLNEAEANFEAGAGIPHEEVMRELDDEIERWEQEEMEMAEVV